MTGSGPGASSGALQQGAEVVEVVGGVVGAGGGFRVVLDAEDRAVEEAQALDHAVVQVDVADHRRTVGGVEGLAGPGRYVGPGSAVARFRGNVWRNCVGRFRGNAGQRGGVGIAVERGWVGIAGQGGGIQQGAGIQQGGGQGGGIRWGAGEGGGESVVVAGDVDPAGGQVHYRLVNAAVAVAE